MSDDDDEEDDGGGDDDDGDGDARGCASEGERCEGRDMREEGVEYKRRTGDGEGGSRKG